MNSSSNHCSSPSHERTPLVSSLELPATPTASNVTEGTPHYHGRVGVKVNVEDDYIVSLIRKTRRSFEIVRDDGPHQNSTKPAFPPQPSSSSQGTTWGQTVIHLVKGYIGCGILSLPWAVSQLGILPGIFGIIFMSIWTSYNCWTVTRLKQYIDKLQHELKNDDDDDDNSDEDEEDNTSRKSGSLAETTNSLVSTATARTYPDVGEWAYGAQFQTYVSVCICAQQLAICTVFVSFVLENVQAALAFWKIDPLVLLVETLVMLGLEDEESNYEEYENDWKCRSLATAGLCLPAFLVLSCGMPTVKSMVPLMVLGTIGMLSGFSLLGWIGYSKWDDRPPLEKLPTWSLDVNDPYSMNNVFMALCGILYSFEGICIILPVESSMKHPVTEFKSAFGVSIVLITLLLCGMGGMGVLVFGEVTNGSITAFLLETYGSSNDNNDDNDESNNDFKGIATKIVLSNVLVSLSIVLSYPLMLYPAVELIAPALFDWKETRRTRKASDDGHDHTAVTTKSYSPRSMIEVDDDDEDSLGFAASKNGDEDDLYEPMEEIPEDSVISLQSLPSLQKQNSNANGENDKEPCEIQQYKSELNDNTALEANASLHSKSIGEETFKTGEAMEEGEVSDSASLLSRLSSNISYQRSIVETDDDETENSEENDSFESEGVPSPPRKKYRRRHQKDTALEWLLPGDSPMLRAGLVLSTFLVAVLIPNVQSLVSLVGAVTGSSTALLIPPILELAYIRHMEAKDANNRLFLGDWEGGPSTASKRLLFGRGNSNSPGSKKKKKKRKRNTYFWDRLLSWFLLILGSAFALIGSFFSVRDILESYQ